MAKKKTSDAREVVSRPDPPPALTNADFLSTGSTTLNLAMTGHPLRGWKRGEYSFIVGRSGSGKTFLTQTAFAEAARNKVFDQYQFLFKDVEGGALMDPETYFGKEAARRIRTTHPLTVEEMYYELDDDLKQGPILCVVDSETALSSEYEGEKHDQAKAAFEKGKDAKGDYGDNKAKVHSRKLRVVRNKLRDTGSILIFVCQSRDNIGFNAMFNPETRPGGRALKFYACAELWTSVTEKLKKRVAGKDREYGIMTKVKVCKNRINGRESSVEIPIVDSVGIDDLAGCVHYLKDNNHWKGKDGHVTAPEFDFDGPIEDLVRKVIQDKAEIQLKKLVTQVWRDIAAQLKVDRPRRYA